MQTDKATVGFLLSVARSRYLDAWRRQRRLQRKLRLVWAAARDTETPEVSAAKVLDHLSACSDEHRVVLMLAYVDGIPVAEIAALLGSSVSSTYSCSRGHETSCAPTSPETRHDEPPRRDEGCPRSLAGGGPSTASPRTARALTGDVVAAIPSADTDPDDREGDLIMLETEDRPTGHEPPTPGRRSPGRWLLVAAVVAVVAVVGALLVAAGGDDEDPVDTATSPTTTAPHQHLRRTSWSTDEGFADLEPGRYFIDPDGDDTTPLRVTYQVAAEGWAAWFGAVK